MKTSKPLSTVSYNTPRYLIFKLEQLRKSKVLSKWYVMPHAPEDDEAGKKYHMHVFVQSNNKVDPDDLRAQFIEPVAGDITRPRKCMPFVPSDFSNWCMYVLHDPAYLASKGQSRRYRYGFKDFLVFDADVFDYERKSISMSDISAYRKMLGFIERGQSFAEFVGSGSCPIPQIRNWQTAFGLLSSHATYRNNKVGHEYLLDSETGEYVEMTSPPLEKDFFKDIGEHLRDYLMAEYFKKEEDTDNGQN